MKVIIIILQAIFNLVRKRRDLIANRNKIPPEYRDDVVVWYSPKKQKLTNYDVIESYAEDFLSNKWVNTENANATITSKTITYNRNADGRNRILSTNKPCESFIIYVTVSTYAWRYQYVNEDGIVQFYDIKNGINVLPKSYNNKGVTIGFLWMGNNIEASISITQLPTSILKDFSGNGLDAYMYGFAGKLNSGIGIYNNDFTDSGRVNVTWVYDSKDITVNGADSFTVHNNYENWVFRCTTNVKSMTVKIVGVSDDVNFKYRYESTNGDKYIYFKKDGVYELPATIGTWQGFNLEKNNDVDVNITVTQIPDYPNSLCYAGKQYCEAYGLPILDDYTIIARRTWFDKDGAFANKGSGDSPIHSLFVFENKANNKTVIRTASFGAWNNVDIPDEGINWQTKNKYNNTDIVSGIQQDGSDIFTIGGYNLANSGNWYGCHDDIIILKRSLTINEINDITKAIFNETIIEE